MLKKRFISYVAIVLFFMVLLHASCVGRDTTNVIIDYDISNKYESDSEESIAQGDTKDVKIQNDIPNNMYEVDSEICEVFNNCEAIVTIISDDGFYESGVLLNDLVTRYNLHATVAGYVKAIDAHLQEWFEITSKGYIELVSHSYNHYRMEEGNEISNNVDILQHEIIDADKYFEKNFGNEQIVFVCPENQMCQLGYKILFENGFYSIRLGARGYNSLSPENSTEPFSWYNLGVMGICDSGISTEERNKWIDDAIKGNKWLIEMWHYVSYEYYSGYYQLITYDLAQEHLSYIAAEQNKGSIWVANFTSATKYLREKQVAKTVTYICNDNLYVNAIIKEEQLPLSVFNFPLTIKVALPYYWKDKELYSENVSDFQIINEDGTSFLLINVIPNNIIKISTVAERNKAIQMNNREK